MKRWEALTGADVKALRTALKLSRQDLHEVVGFPNSKSAARLVNIENRDSWKDGDRELLRAAFARLYADRGLPLPDVLSDDDDDEWTPPPPADVPDVDETDPALDPRPGVDGSVDPTTCPHAGGYSRREDGVWVCAVCGVESPYAEQARLARLAQEGRLDVGTQLQVGGMTFTKVADDPFPSAPTTDVNSVPLDAEAAQGFEPSAEFAAELDRRWNDPATQWVEGRPERPADVVPNGVVPDVDATDPADEEDWWDQLLDGIVVDATDVPAADYRTSHSELATWKRCRRKWWFQYYRRLVPRVDELTSARATGGRVHRALQAWYVADPADRVDPRDALERAIVEDWTEVTRTITNADELAAVRERFDKANALERAIVEGYVQWLAETGADADYQVVGAEQVLAVRLDVDVDGTTYLVGLLGMLDARLRRVTDGALLFVDHKTVGDLTSVVPTLRQNEQMLTYVLLEVLNAAGDEHVDGALYNMLRKVLRTTRANPPFYDRVEVRHNVHEVESYRRRVRATVRDVLRARRALDAGAHHLDVVYPTPTTDCRYDCPMFRVCNLHDDGSPGVDEAVTAVYVEGDPLARYDGLPQERVTEDRREPVQ